jgi:hypothetical protein
MMLLKATTAYCLTLISLNCIFPYHPSAETETKIQNLATAECY